jgi:hypothetical protein
LIFCYFTVEKRYTCRNDSEPIAVHLNRFNSPFPPLDRIVARLGTAGCVTKSARWHGMQAAINLQPMDCFPNEPYLDESWLMHTTCSGGVIPLTILLSPWITRMDDYSDYLKVLSILYLFGADTCTSPFRSGVIKVMMCSSIPL